MDGGWTQGSWVGKGGWEDGSVGGFGWMVGRTQGFCVSLGWWVSGWILEGWVSEWVMVG